VGKSRLNLVGKQFGKLKVLSFAGLDARRNSCWLCVCKCGAKRIRNGSNLKRGGAISCGQAGCRRWVAARAEDHPDFHIFNGILNRCRNKNDKGYPHYGGRGIKVCDRWQEGGFWVFLADMGPRPSPEHSIDRYPNNDGDYEPGNCRWATSKEQGRNRRTNKVLTLNGESLPMSEWAERLGINYRTLKGRIRSGWSVEQALTPELVDHTTPAEVVKAIRKERKAGAKGCDIARKYNLSESSVSEICSRKRYCSI
jgi:hypothetical protein